MKSMKIVQGALLAAYVCFGTAGLTACDQEGPAEQAGERVDKAVKDAKRGVEDATD